MYKIKPIFSLTKGRCYTIYFEKINAGTVYAMVKVQAPRQLQVFAHEPGEEIWFNGPASNWSNSIHFGSEGALDILLQKQIQTKGKNCIKDSNYDYFGMNYFCKI